MIAARLVLLDSVAHTTARVGDARDSWEHGVVSRANRRTQALGVRSGFSLREMMAVA